MSLFKFSPVNENTIEPVNENDEFEVVSEADLADIVAVAIMESCSPEQISALLESPELSSDIKAGIVTERTIVKLDKQAKKNKYKALAIFQVAKEKGDKDYKKLVKLWKLENILEKKLIKKYTSQGEKRAREAMKTAGKAKSKQVKAVAGKFAADFKTTKVGK